MAPGIGVAPNRAGGFTFDTGPLGRRVLAEVPMTRFIGDIDAHISLALNRTCRNGCLQH